jgi:membrane-associated protease RseP (regulator of RpoE activity)
MTIPMPTPRFRSLASLPALLLAAGCCEVRQVAPGPDALLPSVREEVGTDVAGKPFTGLRLQSTISGSLIDLAFEPGLLVLEVAPGSPGEAAGLRAGDRLVAAEGIALESVDQFEALLVADDGAALPIDVERGSGIARQTLVPTRRGGARFEPSHHVERLKARLAARTLERDGQLVVEIVALLPDSPFEGGLAPGEVVLRLDGVAVDSARTLLQWLAAREYGAEVFLEVEGPGGTRELHVELWSPPRELTKLGVPILFTYRRDRAAGEVEFRFVDFWLFALYAREREAARVRHSFLGITIVESGAGELRQAAPEDAETSP